MNRHRLGLIPLFACLAVEFAFAQEPGPPRGKAYPMQAMQREPVATMDVEFQGGTVRQYVEALKKANAAANVSVSTEAADIPIPAVSLKSVSLDTAISMLKGIALNSSSTLEVGDVGGGDGSQPVYIVQLLRPRLAQAKGGVQQLIVSLTDLMNARGNAPEQQEKQLQTILSAVEAALKLGERDGKLPEITVHRESGLLMMRGDEEERRVTQEVLSQIRAGLTENEGTRQNRIFEIQKADARELVNTIYAVYPDRRGENQRKITCDLMGDKILKVGAPAQVLAGIDALVTYFDRVQTTPKIVEQMQGEKVQREERFRAREQALEEEVARTRDRLAKSESEMQARLIEATDAKARAALLEQEVKSLRTRLEEGRK